MTEHINNEIEQDLIDLFTYKKTGHTGKYYYSDPKHSNDPVNGAKLWGDFVQVATQYYLTENEINVIKASAAQVASRVGQDSVIFLDMGVGTDIAVKNKPLSLMKAFNKTAGYIGFDISRDFLELAIPPVQQAYPDSVVCGVHGDFFTTHITHSSNHTQVMTLFGDTLGAQDGEPVEQGKTPRFPHLVRDMKNLRPHLSLKDYFVITQDANQDKVSLLAAYYNSHPAIRKTQTEMARVQLHRLKRDGAVKGDFDINSFSFRIDWNSTEHVIEHKLIAEKDMSFVIGNTPVSVKSGDEFHFCNTYKFPASSFQAAAKESGFDPVDLHWDKDRRIALHVLKAA